MTPVEIPFATLRPQHEALAPELRAAVDRVLGRAWFVLGEEVAAFEQEFAGSVGAAHAVGVASGTDAISLMLLAQGAGPGDEVIFPANTCPATLTGIAATGATPVPVDVDEDSMTLSPPAVARALTPRTRAVVAVHLYGQPADMDALADALAGSSAVLLEDAAQAHGARYAGRCCGSLGNAAAFSFYPSKNLGACGDGGAVTTSDAAVAERLRALRNYGEGARYTLAMPGMNSRLDEVQAAILRTKLPHLEAWNARRAGLARRYRDGLAGLPLTLPLERPGFDCNHHLFVVRTPRRDALAAALREQGIATQAHYPTPGHRHPAYPMTLHPEGSLPVAERLCREVLSLPLYPEMPEVHVDRVVEGIAAFFEST
ncbi:MAG: aminotransferase DegT [Candidatus Hydrogenedentota bacterium]